jgi:hypothetical protein
MNYEEKKSPAKAGLFFSTSGPASRAASYVQKDDPKTG